MGWNPGSGWHKEPWTVRHGKRLPQARSNPRSNTSDGFLIWANYQKAEWERVIPLLEKGSIGLLGIRNGKQVDITKEHLDFIIQRLWVLNDFIAEHEAAIASQAADLPERVPARPRR